MRAPEPRVRVSRCALPGLSSDLLLDSFHLRAVWPEGKLLLGIPSRDMFVSVCQRCWPSWVLPCGLGLLGPVELDFPASFTKRAVLWGQRLPS